MLKKIVACFVVLSLAWSHVAWAPPGSGTDQNDPSITGSAAKVLSRAVSGAASSATNWLGDHLPEEGFWGLFRSKSSSPQTTDVNSNANSTVKNVVIAGVAAAVVVGGILIIKKVFGKKSQKSQGEGSSAKKKHKRQTETALGEGSSRGIELVPTAAGRTSADDDVASVQVAGKKRNGLAVLITDDQVSNSSILTIHTARAHAHGSAEEHTPVIPKVLRSQSEKNPPRTPSSGSEADDEDNHSRPEGTPFKPRPARSKSAAARLDSRNSATERTVEPKKLNLERLVSSEEAPVLPSILALPTASATPEVAQAQVLLANGQPVTAPQRTVAYVPPIDPARARRLSNACAQEMLASFAKRDAGAASITSPRIEPNSPEQPGALLPAALSIASKEAALHKSVPAQLLPSPASLGTQTIPTAMLAAPEPILPPAPIAGQSTEVVVPGSVKLAPELAKVPTVSFQSIAVTEPLTGQATSSEIEANGVPTASASEIPSKPAEPVKLAPVVPAVSIAVPVPGGAKKTVAEVPPPPAKKEIALPPVPVTNGSQSIAIAGSTAVSIPVVASVPAASKKEALPPVPTAKQVTAGAPAKNVAPQPALSVKPVPILGSQASIPTAPAKQTAQSSEPATPSKKSISEKPKLSGSPGSNPLPPSGAMDAGGNSTTRSGELDDF